MPDQGGAHEDGGGQRRGQSDESMEVHPGKVEFSVTVVETMNESIYDLTVSTQN